MKNLLLPTLLLILWFNPLSAEVGQLYNPVHRPPKHKFERHVAISEVDPQGFGLLLKNGAHCQFESLKARVKVRLWKAGDVLSVFYSEDGHIASLYNPRTNVIIYPGPTQK